jgi:hypothetical protein
MPMGEFGVYVDNSGFPVKNWGFQREPVKNWGFQREPVRAKRRATCPTDRAHANRRAHVPNIACALLDLGNPKFSPGHACPPRPRKPQILPWACAPSPTSETPNSPLGMRALPGPRSPQFSPHMGSFSACERSPWKPQNFHWNPQILTGSPNFSQVIISWPCAPSVRQLPVPLGMCTLRLACVRSLWKPQTFAWKHKILRGKPKLPRETPNSSLGMCALRLVCAHSLGHVHLSFGTCTLHMAFARSIGHVCPSFGMRHVFPTFGMRALFVETADFSLGTTDYQWKTQVFE